MALFPLPSPGPWKSMLGRVHDWNTRRSQPEKEINVRKGYVICYGQAPTPTHTHINVKTRLGVVCLSVGRWPYTFCLVGVG